MPTPQLTRTQVWERFNFGTHHTAHKFLKANRVSPDAVLTIPDSFDLFIERTTGPHEDGLQWYMSECTKDMLPGYLNVVPDKGPCKRRITAGKRTPDGKTVFYDLWFA